MSDVTSTSEFGDNDLQPKKTFAIVDYDRCRPRECDPENGRCAAAAVCSRKVSKQIDGRFEPPVIFQDMCMGCWDCIEACPLDAVQIRNVT